MSVSIVVVAVVIAIGIGAWLLFSPEGDSAGAAPAEKQPEPRTFRCNVCGAVSPTFLAAHEHASAEHELAGHKIDESITAE